MSMSDESNALDETLGRLWGYGDAVYKAEAPSELEDVSKANIRLNLGTGSQLVATRWRVIYRLT